jgi:cytochrome P450
VSGSAPGPTRFLSTAPAGDGEVTTAEVAHRHLFAYLAELIEERRREPTDDLLSALVAVRDEDDALDEQSC